MLSKSIKCLWDMRTWPMQHSLQQAAKLAVNHVCCCSKTNFAFFCFFSTHVSVSTRHFLESFCLFISVTFAHYMMHLIFLILVWLRLSRWFIMADYKNLPCNAILFTKIPVFKSEQSQDSTVLITLQFCCFSFCFNFLITF